MELKELEQELRHLVYRERMMRGDISRLRAFIEFDQKTLPKREKELQENQDEINLVLKSLKEACEDGSENEVISRVYETRYDCPDGWVCAYR